MAKDIFGDDYFTKHRDNSSWNSLKGKSISKMLNVKNKSRPKLDEMIDAKAEETPAVEEEIIDEDFKDYVKETAKWKKDFLKGLIAGICGGLIFYLVSYLTSNHSISDSNFWIHVATVLLVGVIFVLVFSLLYKITEDKF